MSFNNNLKAINNLKQVLEKVTELNTGENCIYPIIKDTPDCDLWCFQNIFLKGSHKELLIVPLRNVSKDFEGLDDIIEKEQINKCILLDADITPSPNIKRHIETSISLSELYKRLIDWDSYFNYLEYDVDDDFGTNNIKNLFIPRVVPCLNNSVDNNKSFLNILSDWASSENNLNNQILILGERGTGKSWLVKKFCLEQMNRHKSSVWEFPPAIYINLSIYKQFYGMYGIEKLIAFHITQKYSVSLYGEFDIFEAFAHTGNIILVLDGLDEMEQEMSDSSLQRHIYELFGSIPSTARIILTSRSSVFKSHLNLLRYFSRTEYQISTKIERNNKLNYENISDVEEKNNRNFSIFQLGNYSEVEYRNLVDNYVNNRKYHYSAGLDRLKELISNKDGYASIFESLSKVPAIQSYLQEVLSTGINLDFITILEEVILYCYIDYNIITGRAIGNRPIRLTGHEKLNYFKEEKMNLIQELAWYLFEKNERVFSIKLFPFKIRQIFGSTLKIIENDIRVQTIFKPSGFSEKGKNVNDSEENFEFILPVFFDYFVARHIYSQIIEKNKNYDFGRYRLSNENAGNIAIILKAILDKDEKSKQKLIGYFEELNKLKPYSNELRYARENLLLIGINKQNIEGPNFWQKWDVEIPDNMVLINNGQNNHKLKPYLIGIHEVTNDEFEEFLNGKDGNELWDKKHIYDGTSIYSSLSNQYHLFHWKGEKKPIDQHDHPVVFISWYTAAAYCNWLTKIHFDENELCYSFNKNTSVPVGWDVKFMPNKKGYRLPTGEEWEFAARGGLYQDKSGEEIIFAWDIANEEFEKQRMKKLIMGEREKTIPVLSDEENILGVTGMMGNVREWCNDWGNDQLQIKKVIRGSTSTWGEESFRFSNSIAIYRENTNHDVGFRVARSLDEQERIVLNALIDSIVK